MYTLLPIEDAIIVLPEHDIRASTDSTGTALVFSVPIVSDDAISHAEVPDYGCATILAYRDGYYPYALFYAHVYQDRVREGPTLYMFPVGSEDGVTSTSFVESPDPEWLDTLIEKHDPS